VFWVISVYFNIRNTLLRFFTFLPGHPVYESVRREVLCNIITDFGIPIKLIRIIKMHLNEAGIRVWVGKLLSDMFPIKNGLKQGDALLPLLFNFVTEYAIRRVQVKQHGLKLNCTHQLLVTGDDVNILGGSLHTIKKNTEALVAVSMETVLEVNAYKTKYMVKSRVQKEG
jgi:preprotein translocase subunit YajC